MKLIALLIAFMCSTVATVGQTVPSTTPATQPDGIPLWPGGATDALGTDPVKDIPTLTPYVPHLDKNTDKNSGETIRAAMVICPGGGYAHLAPHEGKDYALWLNQHGIAAYVLKYRLGSNGYRHPVMMHDVQRAIRLVRFHAADWNLNPQQIGVMGSSAGGHLAATALTHFDDGITNAVDPIDRVSCRPDLGVLCYAVITMGPLTHGGSKANLLGKDPAPDVVKLMSNELQVTKDTPPTFIWHTAEDHTVNVQNSIDFASALHAKGIPFELHVYPYGPHGQGLGVKNYNPATIDAANLLPWTQELARWLQTEKFSR